MRKGQALAILREELKFAGTSTDYDFTVKDEMRSEAQGLEWWRTRDTEPGDTPRNKAYFRAYTRIANEDGSVEEGVKLPSQGLRLKPKGRLWMDRYVVGKLHERGFLDYQTKPDGMYEPAFVVTKAGQEWAAQ